MGSFQKGMGESLTGRLRKQLDIPDAPKREIDTNIPIDQIRGLKYLAQVRRSGRRMVAGYVVNGWREHEVGRTAGYKK